MGLSFNQQSCRWQALHSVLQKTVKSTFHANQTPSGLGDSLPSALLPYIDNQLELRDFAECWPQIELLE